MLNLFKLGAAFTWLLCNFRIILIYILILSELYPEYTGGVPIYFKELRRIWIYFSKNLRNSEEIPGNSVELRVTLESPRNSGTLLLLVITPSGYIGKRQPLMMLH